MHGRLKVKTTEQQKEEKRKKQQKKLELFQGASKKAFLKRENRELDEDALKLTTEILSLNPDFYSLWNFRKEIILEFKRTRKEEEIIKLFKDDLGFTEICLRNNPKSYCAWHHRHWVMQNTPKPDWERELKICNQYLLLDERNFHCWDYRRFVVQESGISNNKELEFSSEKIENNFSNYSAWHYRSKLLPLVHAGNSYKKIDESKLLEEFELVQNAAFTDPNDQSAWFYHRWLLGRSDSVPEVYSFIISKLNENHTVVVSFSSPILINEENKLVLLLNEERVELPWYSPDSNSFSSRIWMGCLHHKLMEHSSSIKIELMLNGSVILICEMNNSTDELFQEGRILSKDLFRSDFSAATCSFLRDELESCKQLQELEPDDKWTMLTSVFLMKAIDSQSYLSTIVDCLKKLSKNDINRSMYYEDLRSRFIVENAIETKKLSNHELDMSGMDFTVLYHTYFLTELKKLNLTNNLLTKLPTAFHMPFLKELILDDNKIEVCQGIEKLSCLIKFSAVNNYLQDVQSIYPIFSCTKLQDINIKGNPVSEDLKNLKIVIKNHLDDIMIINEEEVE